MLVLSFFFFFQAEDGIRDLTVTGVQTCALPISFVAMPCICRLLGERDHRSTIRLATNAWHRSLAPSLALMASISDWSVDIRRYATNSMTPLSSCRSLCYTPLRHMRSQDDSPDGFGPTSGTWRSSPLSVSRSPRRWSQ